MDIDNVIKCQAKLTESALNDFIAGDGDAPALDLSKSSLVDELAYALEVGVSPCNMRLADTQHVQGSLQSR